MYSTNVQDLCTELQSMAKQSSESSVKLAVVVIACIQHWGAEAELSVLGSQTFTLRPCLTNKQTEALVAKWKGMLYS